MLEDNNMLCQGRGLHVCIFYNIAICITADLVVNLSIRNFIIVKLKQPLLSQGNSIIEVKRRDEYFIVGIE